MKNISIVFFIIGVLISNHSNADHVLYCQEELTTGFVNKDGSWRSAEFNKSRYTIKFKNDYSTLEGLSNKRFSCSTAYPQHPDSLVCTGEYGSENFIFNKKTKRFLYAYISPIGGYVDKGKDTENFSVGTCEKF